MLIKATVAHDGIQSTSTNHKNISALQVATELAMMANEACMGHSTRQWPARQTHLKDYQGIATLDLNGHSCL